MATAVMVGPADLRVRRASGLLTCLGLRTVACLCLFDPETRVGGMVHITHAEPGELTLHRPGKYAPSGLEGLIQSMERTGAFRHRLTAVIVGGCEVSVRGTEEDKDPLVLDAGTCRAVELELQRQGIPLEAKEIGGRIDRTVMFDVAHGTVRVRSENSDVILCHMGGHSKQAIAA